MTARARALRDLARELGNADAQARLGSVEQVLVERAGEGMSESYHRVAAPASAEVGALIPMRLQSYHDGLFTGSMASSASTGA
jgi:tRNA A37 methylthiotransferase MiaB